MSAPVPYQISKALPTLGDLQSEIAALQSQLANPSLLAPIRITLLRAQLLQKQRLLSAIQNPSGALPPPPDAPAILAPRIPTPKIGLSDLTIPTGSR